MIDDELQRLAKNQMGRFERMGCGPTIRQLGRDLLGDETVEQVFAAQVNGQQAVVAFSNRGLIVTYGVADHIRSVRAEYAQIEQVEVGLAQATLGGADIPELQLKGIGRLKQLLAELQARRDEG